MRWLVGLVALVGWVGWVGIDQGVLIIHVYKFMHVCKLVFFVCFFGWRREFF